MIKLSIFNEYVLDKEDVIVYNNKPNSSIRFKKTTIDIVKDFMINSSNMEFFNYGMVVYEDIDEFEIASTYYGKMSTDVSNYMISVITTYQCNCFCDYCFEKNFNDKLNLESLPVKVVKYIKDIYYSNNLERISLNYFGGEPLLNINAILFIHDELVKSNINIVENITTNGTLFSVDNIRSLCDRGIKNYQVTIDGSKEIHDRRRPLKSGRSAWEDIVKGLELLIKESVYVDIRINIDSNNIIDIENLFKTLPDKIIFSNKIGFYLASIIGQGNSKFNDILASRSDAMIAAWEIIRKKRFPVRISLPIFAPCSKDSLSNGYYIDLVGRLYSCGADIGDFKKAEGVFKNKNENYFKRSKKQIDKKCYRCSFFYQCMGGCDYETSIHNKYCQKEFFKRVYNNYYLNYAR